MESTLVGDPVLVRFFAHHEPFRPVMDRLYRLLMGGDDGPEARMSAVMLTAAIGGAVMHPLAADLDDDTLRSQLLHLARRFLSLPDRPPIGVLRPRSVTVSSHLSRRSAPAAHGGAHAAVDEDVSAGQEAGFI